MRRIGLDVDMQEAAPGRPNVIGVLEGRRAGRSLMFCGHIDTVGVEGMDGAVRSGRARRPAVRPRLAGHEGRRRRDDRRGAASRRRAGSGRGRLIVAAVVDEEYASIGADALVERVDGGRAPSSPSRPTCRSASAHKGFAWAEVETRGRAAHGSRPIDGRDAIMRMGRVLARLERLDRELQARAPHPLIGDRLAARVDHRGGRELSSYPDRCRLQLERRTVPGETADTFAAEIDALLDRTARQEDSEFEASVSLTFSRVRRTRCHRRTALPRVARGGRRIDRCRLLRPSA